MTCYNFISPEIERALRAVSWLTTTTTTTTAAALLAKRWRSCQCPGGPVGIAAPGPTDASRLSGGSLPRAWLPALLLPAPTLTVDSLPADDRRECRSPVKEGGVGEVRLAATASADELTRGQTMRRRRHSIAGRRSVGRSWRTVFPS